MNPIEKLIMESAIAAHKDTRTKESVEATLLRWISKDAGISGCHDVNVAFERAVARKITSEEFARALSTIASHVMEIFPVMQSCPASHEPTPDKGSMN